MTNRIPAPPISMKPEEHHRVLTDICTYLRTNFGAGTSSTHLTQAEIDKLIANNDKKDAGKRFYNVTEHDGMHTKLDSNGNLVATNFGD